MLHAIIRDPGRQDRPMREPTAGSEFNLEHKAIAASAALRKQYSAKGIRRNIGNPVAECCFVERLVFEMNNRVDRQRKFIHQLAGKAEEAASAEIVLESLLASLFLAAEYRHRLRAMLDKNQS